MSEIDYEKLYKKWHYQILQYPGNGAMSVIPAGFTGFCRDNKTNSTHIHKILLPRQLRGDVGLYKNVELRA